MPGRSGWLCQQLFPPKTDLSGNIVTQWIKVVALPRGASLGSSCITSDAGNLFSCLKCRITS